MTREWKIGLEQGMTGRLDMTPNVKQFLERVFWIGKGDLDAVYALHDMLCDEPIKRHLDGRFFTARYVTFLPTYQPVLIASQAQWVERRPFGWITLGIEFTIESLDGVPRVAYE